MKPLDYFGVAWSAIRFMISPELFGRLRQADLHDDLVQEVRAPLK